MSEMSPRDDGSGTKSGWLNKQEQIAGSLQSWKKRWFVLTPQILGVYKTPKEATQPDAVPLVKVPTESLSAVDSTHTEKKHSFKVSCKTLADLQFCCDELKLKEEWMAAFTKAISVAEDTAKRQQAAQAVAPVVEEEVDLLKLQEEMMQRIAALRGDRPTNTVVTAEKKDDSDDEDEDDDDDDDDEDEDEREL